MKKIHTDIFIHGIVTCIITSIIFLGGMAIMRVMEFAFYLISVPAGIIGGIMASIYFYGSLKSDSKYLKIGFGITCSIVLLYTLIQLAIKYL